MGIMDKVKAQAEQAMAKAQEGIAQGQAKLEAYQARHGSDALLTGLGRAVWAQRTGVGSQAGVDAAAAALQAYADEHGPIDLTPPADDDTPTDLGPSSTSPNLDKGK